MSKTTKTAPKSVTPRQPWVEAFRAGTHTDASGKEHTYSDADIDTMAAKINAQVSSGFVPPVVTGHPVSDSPRQAGVYEAHASGSSPRRLYVRVDEVVPSFAEAIQEGQYRYVSVALYSDLGLRHLGVLGGSNPAVKGMAALEFGEGMFAEADSGKSPEDVLVFSEDWSPMDAVGMAFLRISWRIQTVGGLLASQREQMIATTGSVDEADKVLPSYAIDMLKEFDLGDLVAQLNPPADPASFSDPHPDGTPPSTLKPPAPPAPGVDAGGEGDPGRPRVVSLQSHAAFTERLDALAGDGRLLPSQRKPLEELFKTLSNAHSDVMYAEGEEAFAPLNSLLDSLPKSVEFGERNRPDKATPTQHPLIADAERRGNR